MASLARRRAAQTDFWRCGLDWLEGPNTGELVVVARARRLTATQPPIKAAHAGKTDLVIASIAARSRRQCADLSVQVSGPCCLRTSGLRFDARLLYAPAKLGAGCSLMALAGLAAVVGRRGGGP